MMHALDRRRDEVAIFRCQSSMAKPDDSKAVERAFLHGAIRRPVSWTAEQPCGEALCDSPEVNRRGQVDVDEGVGGSETLPCRGHASIAVDNPLFPLNDAGVQLQVCVVRKS